MQQATSRKYDTDFTLSEPAKLAKADAHKFHKLMQDISARLDNAGHGHFLKDKPNDFLNDPKVEIIGITNSFGEVVSGAILMASVGRSGTSPVVAEALHRYPLDGQGDVTAVIGSLGTAAGYGGRNLAGLVLEKAIEEVKENGGIRFILASVAEDNVKSQDIFEKHGFQVVGSGTDFVKGHKKNFLRLGI